MRVLSASKLKAFHLAGLTGRFKHAAHLLAVSPSAVSARVRSLENDLGVRLFARGIRKLALTEAGADSMRDVELVFANLDGATRDLRLRFAEARFEAPGRDPARETPLSGIIGPVRDGLRSAGR